MICKIYGIERKKTKADHMTNFKIISVWEYSLPIRHSGHCFIVNTTSKWCKSNVVERR